MTIDKQKLQKLLWAEAASFRADCADWKRNTEALQEFLGEKTVEEVALELLADTEVIRKDLESHKRMLLAAVCDIGAIGKALKADMNADGDELLGTVIDLKAQNTRMLGWLQDISRTSGDKGAVMGARQLLKEFGQ
jgi:hypothetical protein